MSEAKIKNAIGFYINLQGFDFDKWREGGKDAEYYTDVRVCLNGKNGDLTAEEFWRRVSTPLPEGREQEALPTLQWRIVPDRADYSRYAKPGERLVFYYFLRDKHYECSIALSQQLPQSQLQSDGPSKD